MSGHEPCHACGRCVLCGHGALLPVWLYPWWHQYQKPPPQLTSSVQYHAPAEFLPCSKGQT